MAVDRTHNVVAEMRLHNAGFHFFHFPHSFFACSSATGPRLSYRLARLSLGVKHIRTAPEVAAVQLISYRLTVDNAPAAMCDQIHYRDLLFGSHKLHHLPPSASIHLQLTSMGHCKGFAFVRRAFHSPPFLIQYQSDGVPVVRSVVVQMAKSLPGVTPTSIYSNILQPPKCEGKIFGVDSWPEPEVSFRIILPLQSCNSSICFDFLMWPIDQQRGRHELSSYGIRPLHMCVQACVVCVCECESATGNHGCTACIEKSVCGKRAPTNYSRSSKQAKWPRI